MIIPPGLIDDVALLALRSIGKGSGPIPGVIKKLAWPATLAFLAAEVSHAKKGRLLSTTLGATISNMGPMMIPMFLGVGPVGLGLSVLSAVGGQKIGAAFQWVVNENLRAHRVNFGQGWRDSPAAFTMRQRSELEMSGSLLNARAILGREANNMHF